MGLLGLQMRNARLEGTPPYLTVHTRGNAGAKVGLDITHPHILIDSTPSRESMGIYTVLRRYKKFAAESNQRGIEQIGRIAREGLEIMEIERGGRGEGAIQRIARNKGRKDVRLTIRAAALPNINVRPGAVNIRDESTKVQSTTRKGADTTRYVPSSISISWKQKPAIELTFIRGSYKGVNIDTGV